MLTEWVEWDVWLARVKFEETDEESMRPVLLTNQDDTIKIYCLKMTSHEPRRGEYSLIRWVEAGLRMQTTVRVEKLLYLETDRFIHRIGHLDPADIIGIQQIINRTHIR